jgi:hypothetical protein
MNMAKQKSTRETANMIQSSVWLPRDMHEQLKQAGGERGLADEIRRRVQLTFTTEGWRRDEKTRSLLEEIEQLALSMSFHDHWHAAHFTFRVFKQALNRLLSSYEPGEDTPGTVTRLQAKYGSDVKPETIGEIIADTIISQRETAGE